MDATEPKEIPGVSRMRTESTSSDMASPRFILPGTACSPPKVMTLDEVQSTMKNLQDMALAHEIAVNAEFKLQPYEPPENSIEKIIKDTLHKAFWDVLRSQLESDPPQYEHAIQLLSEIKEGFQTILTKNNQKALDRINEILDEAVIKQQAEQKTLDFRAYANFVTHVMSLACAPVRDEQVSKLKDIEDVVDTFRAIFETLSLMKLDMANCLLDASRNDVIANSVEYEKKKFKEYLDLVEVLPATEGWLKRNQVPSNGTQDPQRVSKDTIFNAYLELIDWNPENTFPEIISMDRDRIFGLQSRSLRLSVAASVMAIVAGLPVISEFRKQLADQVVVILQNVENNKDLEDTIENVWLHINKTIDDKLKSLDQAKMDDNSETALKNQILQIAKPDSPVRSLLWQRFLTYIRLILRSNQPVPIPPGFTDYGEELGNFATAFKRVTYYNYAVYREYYHDILDKIINAPVPNSQAATTTD